MKKDFSALRCLALLMFYIMSMTSYAVASVQNTETQYGRLDIRLDEGWTVKPLSNPNHKAKQKSVTLPHTWNVNYLSGTHEYNRETMVYKRKLEVTPDMRGKRLFLYFEGVNSAGTVFVNYRTVGEHKGGYTAFCYEITDYVSEGSNEIEVWASNSHRTDVLPISGDFNVYGGIHRPVHLIVTDMNCIEPTFYTSSGVLVHQESVDAKKAEICVETLLSLRGDKNGMTLRTIIVDADGEEIKSCESGVDENRSIARFTIPKTKLWNGRKSPYLYKVRSMLMQGGKCIDMVEQHTGLRSFSVDADKGFYLNGESYALYGFNRHDNFSGKGSALTASGYEKDMELINEAGATMIRLAHYPHGEPIYQLCDESGVVVWTEIPLCGPGGYLFTGYLKSVEDNARQVLK